MRGNINFTIKIQILAIILLLIIFIFKFNRFPPQAPLYYSRPEGEDQIADSFMIFLLPIISFLTIIFNFYIFKKYFINNLFIQSVIYWVSLLIIFIASFIFLNIIFLIT